MVRRCMMPEEKAAEPTEKKPDDEEIVLPPDHPLYGVFGVWKDQPERLERMTEAVVRYRRKIAREEARAARAAK
jgi:hypothetical protein